MHVPLFPLNTVLFPGMPLSLHIFEERYKRMIGLCLRERLPFGVVLIKSGVEVGGPAVPHDVGTLARIREHRQLDGGGSDIVALGRQRFRILELDRSLPYLAARVALLAEEPGDGAALPELVATVRGTFAEYVRLTLALQDQWARVSRLPEGAVPLSHYAAGRLEVSLQDRQRMLEAETAEVRLRLAKEHLESGVLELSARVRAHYGDRFGQVGALS